ncbi:MULTISPECIES: hypothetical protein [Deinococcus]|uniref:Lipoprotein n=2 Tax=Deinococcus TaxID=1298 RepID=A0ABR6MRF1_9DEIO|nr:hypothetical protein [Deinococcus metallilatus]MBB5294509.1 hypothetical protein [Deinococcus metallilatus]GMA15724.1 hypothetical protein GCM10025871_20550 [Deinococcus metallilatus]
MRSHCSWKYRLALLLFALSQCTLIQFALADPTTGSGGIGG